MTKTKAKEKERRGLKQAILAQPAQNRILARMPDKPKAKTKQQADGKDYDSPKARPKTLAELWGFRGDDFGTVDEDEYNQKLSTMNKADLQMACIKIGLMPHDSRQIMEQRLLGQFRQRVLALQTLNVKPQPTPKMNNKLRKVFGDMAGNTLR